MSSASESPAAFTEHTKKSILVQISEKRPPIGGDLPIHTLYRGPSVVIKELLRHLGFALSEKDIWDYAHLFEVQGPERVVELSNTHTHSLFGNTLPKEESLANQQWARMKARDALLHHLQTTLNLPSLTFKKCLNIGPRIWVLTLRSNFVVSDQDPNSVTAASKDGTVEGDKDTIVAQSLGKIREALSSKLESPLKEKDLKALWYVDYELCGDRFIAPEEENNIPKADQKGRWRDLWTLEELIKLNRHQYNALQRFEDPGLVFNDTAVATSQ